MGSYLLVFCVAALATILWMPPVMHFGRWLGAVDDTRSPPVPRVGGWAILLGQAISLALVGIVFAPTGRTLLAAPESLKPVIAGAVGIFLLGAADDVRPLGAGTKLGIQVLIALAVYFLGVRVEVVSVPFGNIAVAPVLSAVITVLWLVGVANAFNLLDGADGVAAGSAFFAATAVFMMSVALGHPAIGLIAAALAGGMLGFLPFNFPPAKAFLGDSGSLVAGFLLAGLAVEGSTKGPTLVAIAVPLVAFAVPMFDTTITLIRRLVRGRPLFERDQSHVHHRLAQVGLAPRQVALTIYAVSAGVALLSMLFLNPSARSYGVGLAILGAGVWITARYLRLHEINELARLARKGALQPKRIAVNVGLRRAAERLEAVSRFEDILAGLEMLFAGAEFDEVVFVAWVGPDRRGTSRAWRLMNGTFTEGWPPRARDEWEVTCPFEGNGWAGELRLRRRLGRRTLLLDFNLLLEVVQPALTEAARQVEAETVAVA
jgi:UDP-GlcNAc:undecaprenyl-phosphate GlcNAc-1-phosphate transferase